MVRKKSNKFLIFHTSEEQFAVSINNILTIEKLEYEQNSTHDSRIRKVNSYPDYIEGVFSYKHKVLPIIEFEFFLAKKKMRRHGENKIIILKGKESLYAILVDDVHEILELDTNTFEKVYKEYPIYIAEKDNEIYIIPDIDEMINNENVGTMFKDIQRETIKKRKE